MNIAKRFTAIMLTILMIFPCLSGAFTIAEAAGAVDDPSKVELKEIRYTFHERLSSGSWSATNKKGNTSREVTYNGYQTDGDGYLDKIPLASFVHFKNPAEGAPMDFDYSNFDATLVLIDKNVKVNDVEDLKELKALKNLSKVDQELSDFPVGGNNGQPTDIVFSKSSDGYVQIEITFEKLTYADHSDTALLAFQLVYTDNMGSAEIKHNYPLKMQMIGANKAKTGNGSGGDWGENGDNDNGGGSNDPNDVTIKSSTPYVIVSNYTIDNDKIEAGSPFNITLDIRNTHPRISIDNILMTVTTGDGLQLANSSNTFYISKLKSDISITKTMSFTALPNADVKSHPINIEFAYEYVANDQRSTGQTRETITIPVTQRDRFSAFTSSSPPEIYPNEVGDLTISYVNKGRSQVFNLTAEIKCDGINNGSQQQNLGNIAAGAGGDVSFELTPTVEGPISGEVLFTYENASTDILKYSVPFSTTSASMGDSGMESPDIAMPDGEIPSEVPTGQFVMPNWGWGLVALGGIVIVTGGIYFYIKKKHSKDLVDDDEDI